ncbi:MAG: hypothetical protein J7K54_01395 [Candidatus Aenigmarchaeota archaeon]|nr:hypothetical protein [Candidatus Aenigmarchaeota archaeon]
MVRKVLFFGSAVSGDDTAFRVMDILREKIRGKAELLKCESIYDIPEEGEVTIVDVVKGLEKVSLFEDIESFRHFRSVSAHDLDLGTHLQIMKEMGWPLRVRIIGIPYGMEPEKAAPGVEDFIS